MLQATAFTTAIVGFIVMFLEAMLIPLAWLAGVVIGLTGLALSWVIVTGEKVSSL
jgi:hypothetical protein